MAKVTYIEFDGTEHAVDIPSGSSVMEGAINNNIPGIEAECGGMCSCATCHVYVDQAWAEATGSPADIERSFRALGTPSELGQGPPPAPLGRSRVGFG